MTHSTLQSRMEATEGEDADVFEQGKRVVLSDFDVGTYTQTKHPTQNTKTSIVS